MSGHVSAGMFRTGEGGAAVWAGDVSHTHESEIEFHETSDMNTTSEILCLLWWILIRREDSIGFRSRIADWNITLNIVWSKIADSNIILITFDSKTQITTQCWLFSDSKEMVLDAFQWKWSILMENPRVYTLCFIILCVLKVHAASTFYQIKCFSLNIRYEHNFRDSLFVVMNFDQTRGFDWFSI